MDKYVAEEIAAPLFGSMAVVVRTDRDDRFLSVETVGWALTRDGALDRARRAASSMRLQHLESWTKVRKLMDDERNS